MAPSDSVIAISVSYMSYTIQTHNWHEEECAIDVLPFVGVTMTRLYYVTCSRIPLWQVYQNPKNRVSFIHGLIVYSVGYTHV